MLACETEIKQRCKMVERVSAKRYGVRYGRKLREKVGKIDRSRLSSKQCPHCNYKRVKRVPAGIWNCTKCASKFTGRAYSIGSKVDVAGPSLKADAAEAEEEPEEEEEQEEETFEEKEALAQNG